MYLKNIACILHVVYNFAQVAIYNSSYIKEKDEFGLEKYSDIFTLFLFLL